MSRWRVRGPKGRPGARWGRGAAIGGAGHAAGALGPVGLGRGEGGEVLLEGEAGDGVVGLGLEPGREDAPLGRGAELGHAAPVEEVRDQRGDEHGLARAREARDAQADHRIPEGGGHRLGHVARGVPRARRERADHSGASMTGEHRSREGGAVGGGGGPPEGPTRKGRMAGHCRSELGVEGRR
jgi:hypothetical protein